jgi:hypothetical protein
MIACRSAKLGAGGADMADYYSLLERKIKETMDDPAKGRQVVYEAARLALKRQVLLQQPPIAVRETWRLMNDLEDAIARCEADWEGSGRRKSTGPKRRHDHDDGEGEADEAPARRNRAAREDRTAGGTHARRANGRSAFAESEEDEAHTRPTQDRRMRSDPRSGLRNTDRDDRHPVNLDEEDEAVPRANRAAPERQRATDARRANGRYASVESEEDEARTTPTSSRRMRSDPRSGFRTTDHDDRGPINLDEDDEARTNRATRDRRNAGATYGSRASGRSPVAESEDEADARPTYERRMRSDPDSVERLRVDHHDRATNPDGDSGSAPVEPDVEEPRPRNRFRDPSRELVLVPSRSTYVVRPDDFPPSTDIIYEAPPDPVKVFGPMLWSGARVVFQVVVAVLAAAAFYVTVWQRNLGQPAQNAPATMAQDKGRPGNPSNAAPAAVSGGAGEIATPSAAAGTALAGAMLPVGAPAAPAFPYPTSYGIYAISNNQLIELEQIPTAPVDPRTRSVLQIVKPSRSIILDPRLTFLAFRRDLVSSAPEKVPVRIAARIAHSMIFDSSGKPVVTTPETETWLIRDQGYDLRVAPVRESAEMVALRPDDPDFVFPAGRYELLLGGQYYDFIVAGNVTDPAQCVEGFATVRGPAFYECKAQ